MRMQTYKSLDETRVFGGLKIDALEGIFRVAITTGENDRKLLGALRKELAIRKSSKARQLLTMVDRLVPGRTLPRPTNTYKMITSPQWQGRSNTTACNTGAWPATK